jgi:uncharacterized protein (UPF0261 family)
MAKTVLIVSTMDTKGRETLYLRKKVAQAGLNCLLMDLAMRGDADSPAHITPAEVAAAGGSTLHQIQASRERSWITRVIVAGAEDLARELLAEGRLDGVIGVGGSTGSLMATDVMRALPFGLPKVMVSSTAALPGLATRYIGTGDIALFHSVVEISGLSDPLRNVLDRAAAAIAGMVQGEVTPPKSPTGKAVAMTMLGPCEQCAAAVRRKLEKAGWQVIGFSAAGIGDRAMETMIAQGFFRGVIDLAPGGVGEHLFGFMRDAGAHRLESAARAGIPQIVSTCSVNHITPSKSKYKPEYHQRRKYNLDRFRTWVRISPEELKQVAVAFAEKLNMARGTVKVIIPLRGWSAVDVPGAPTYDPGEDRLFTEQLQEKLHKEIEVLQVDANLEDASFADAVARCALEIL